MINIASDNSNSILAKLDSASIQPNAVDLRLDKVWEMHGKFTICETQKQHRVKHPISTGRHPGSLKGEDWYYLKTGVYEISFDNTIKIGEDEAGFVITRSSLNRNGVFITSGLYDSSYGKGSKKGSPLAGALHVSDDMWIERGTRVGQFLLWKAEALHQYDGAYGFGKEGDSHLTEE